MAGKRVISRDLYRLGKYNVESDDNEDGPKCGEVYVTDDGVISVTVGERLVYCSSLQALAAGMMSSPNDWPTLPITNCANCGEPAFLDSSKGVGTYWHTDWDRQVTRKSLPFVCRNGHTFILVQESAFVDAVSDG